MRDAISAFDFISTATILGKRDQASEAIDFLQGDRDIPEHLKTITQLNPDTIIDSSFVFKLDTDKRKIRFLRSVLRDWPRNAICWTQLALSYSRLGINKKAERCINIALSLAPHNRYVLRSASRFFVHIDESPRAAWELKRSITDFSRPVVNGCRKSPFLKYLVDGLHS